MEKKGKKKQKNILEKNYFSIRIPWREHFVNEFIGQLSNYMS